jgi:hypothetical protein
MTLMAYLSYMLAELRLLKCISYSTLLCIFIVLVSDPPLHRQLHEMPQVCRNSPSMFFFQFLRLFIPLSCLVNSWQKVVLRVPTITDDKIKQKVIESVADIYGNNLHLGVESLNLLQTFTVTIYT